MIKYNNEYCYLYNYLPNYLVPTYIYYIIIHMNNAERVQVCVDVETIHYYLLLIYECINIIIMLYYLYGCILPIKYNIIYRK